MELKVQLDGMMGAGRGVAEPGGGPGPLGRRAHAPQRGGRRRPQPEDRRPQIVLRGPRAHPRAGKDLLDDDKMRVRLLFNPDKIKVVTLLGSDKSITITGCHISQQ